MKRKQLLCYLKLTFCTMTLCNTMLLTGGSFVYPSIMLAQLREPSSKIILNMDEESWITSITALICPFGLISIGILADKIGRRKAIQISYIPMIISWLIIAIANSYETIMIGRVLLGIPFGVGAYIMLYISEVCPPGLRPLHCSVVITFAGVGMLAVCLMSIYCRWQMLSAILCAISVVNFFAMFAVPETSMWLRAKGRTEEADQVDKWFDVNSVTGPIGVGSDDDRCRTDVNINGHSAAEPPKSSYWSLYLSRTVWKPTLITVGFFICQQCSGVYVLLFYSMDVLRDCRVPWDGFTVSAIMSAARLVGGLCFTSLHRVNRRTLIAVSGVFMALSLIIIVAYMKTFEHAQDPPFMIVLVIAFTVYMFSALLGILPLPWSLCGEVFPMAVKGVMNGIVQTIGYLLWFSMCKVYPFLTLKYGVECVWSVFAVFCILNIVFAIYIIPETKGRSLDEISSSFKAHKKIKQKNIP